MESAVRSAKWIAGRVRGVVQVKRAIQLRNIVTSLGPAYIKLGQALSIRPDILSPAAMNELQKLCDKVPSFNSRDAMQVIEDELGAPWHQVWLLTVRAQAHSQHMRGVRAANCAYGLVAHIVLPD